MTVTCVQYTTYIGVTFGSRLGAFFARSCRRQVRAKKLQTRSNVTPYTRDVLLYARDGILVWMRRVARRIQANIPSRAYGNTSRTYRSYYVTSFGCFWPRRRRRRLRDQKPQTVYRSNSSILLHVRFGLLPSEAPKAPSKATTLSECGASGRETRIVFLLYIYGN